MLDCSVGNSKSQLHKAKMKMRDLLFPKRRVLRRASGYSGGRNRRRSEKEFNGAVNLSAELVWAEVSKS